MKWAKCCGARFAHCLPIDRMIDVPIPLSDWADRQLARIATIGGSEAIRGLSGALLLGERAALNGFRRTEGVSAGGGCRLYPCHAGVMALNLSRPEDRELLPALFGDADVVPEDLPARFLRGDPDALLNQGRSLGLAMAYSDETPSCAPAIERRHLTNGHPPRKTPLLVVDLSALWAGPLAGHMLWRSGARVVKVESMHRPDAMRDGDPPLFALLNQGKASVQLDLRSTDGLSALRALLLKADMVIEAARPRALMQMGIDAEKIVAAKPSLIWLSITGHGGTGDAANWVGFGDDCGVAGGITKALYDATGQWGFVGDAIADPLTGIAAAYTAFDARLRREGGRYVLSMADIVLHAIAEDRSSSPARFQSQLLAWSRAIGKPFSGIPRQPTDGVAPLGHDTATFTRCL